MKKYFLIMLLSILLIVGCKKKETTKVEKSTEFEFVVDRFADVEVMRYHVDNWEELTLNQKKLVYYLSEAALCGREITFDQNCEYNLLIKNTLEAIVATYKGDRDCENWKKFLDYAKRFWFSNGIHHHYSNAKFYPEVNSEYFSSLLDNSDKSLIFKGTEEQLTILSQAVIKAIYDTTIAQLKVSKDAGKDLVKNSAVNFYKNVTQEEVENFYKIYRQSLKKEYNPNRPISIGLNAQVYKDLEFNKVYERVYKIGGMYTKQIEKIVFWLEKASTVAENDEQKQHILKLIEFYTTGSLSTWDDFNVLWVKDVNSRVDYVNGFIEVYNDPLGQKATWEAVVNYKDEKNSKRTQIISDNAQWFENNSPIDQKYKKKEVKGVTAKVITVAQLGGDCYPTTPIGINLPNANWIRKEHGSKSVTMENIVYAYSQARLKSGVPDEFYYSENEVKLAEKYGYLGDNLHTDMHECLGHGSGQMLPGIDDAALKNYHSVIEETRADLFALYYLADPKMVELGLLPNEEAYRAEYYKYIINGMMLQLNRIELGHEITQAHMRNRAIIANWCFEQGAAEKVIEKVIRDGKTYIKINDYAKLRTLFGNLLAKIQDIKSTGNYNAAQKLVEGYGIKIDPVLHKEIKERYAKLDIAPYGGFINPKYNVIKNDKGEITDIQIDYSENYIDQMMRYAKSYSFMK